MTEYSREQRGIKIALATYVFLSTVQFVAYVLTNVLVLLAQALEMLSDVLISAFLLLSVHWSHKEADEFHMFGHGRSQNVAGLVSATILVFFMSIEVFRETIPRFFQPQTLAETQDATLALIVILAGMFLMSIPTLLIFRTKEKGASARAQLVGLLKDEVSYVAALVATVLVSRGYYQADPVASLFVGAAIASSGVYLFRDNVHYLVGRAPDRAFLDKVESTARSVEGVFGVHELRAEYVGPNIVHAGLHIEVAKGTPIEDADRLAHEVARRVSEATGCQHCVIHVDPANHT